MTHLEFERQKENVHRYAGLIGSRNEKIEDLGSRQAGVEGRINNYSGLSATAKTRLINFARTLYDEERQKCHAHFERETAKIGGEA